MKKRIGVLALQGDSLLHQQTLEKLKQMVILDIVVKRTAYGRQIHSFVQVGKVNLQNGNPNFEMVFIRAPKIVNVGKTVERIGFCDDEVGGVRDRNLLGRSFHPELTADTRIHQYFVNQFLN